ncbi:hypothetical protein [Microseira wollei]|uniref:Uncharacterized protein n=1 Tax=Microseira wollei NIES-4236 TaxID=2530354 RepID=A0AAV3XE77_9CYAN|nr:hypothetical protein [Microseira wollei]GET39120.1 hypothetical protein MiSe_38840 [Microseira wollei NIES-4236]
MTHSLASAAASIQSQPAAANLHSLAVLWARKYYLSVTSQNDQKQQNAENLTEISSKQVRSRTSNKLIQNLTLASAKGWALTETLLSKEIRRHGINPELINPLEIAADIRNLYEKALDAYAEGVAPQRLSVMVGKYCGRVRKKYTSNDPRAIGFVSMQFHHTGQKLLEWLSGSEKELFAPYLKVMDDHMYMPLSAAYEAAAKHELDSPQLQAVQYLLPMSTKIAHSVCDRVAQQHPGYHTYTGALNSEMVRISSVRDVEMFQVYLCLCVLESNIRTVQQELFPLCVMLYPRLKVSWTLVQEMLLFMSWEMQERLPLKSVPVFLPYLRTFSEMFSKAVFQNE